MHEWVNLQEILAFLLIWPIHKYRRMCLNVIICQSKKKTVLFQLYKFLLLYFPLFITLRKNCFQHFFFTNLDK